jgi:hypothetical protein
MNWSGVNILLTIIIYIIIVLYIIRIIFCQQKNYRTASPVVFIDRSSMMLATSMWRAPNINVDARSKNWNFGRYEKKV